MRKTNQICRYNKKGIKMNRKENAKMYSKPSQQPTQKGNQYNRPRINQQTTRHHLQKKTKQ